MGLVCKQRGRIMGHEGAYGGPDPDPDFMPKCDCQDECEIDKYYETKEKPGTKSPVLT